MTLEELLNAIQRFAGETRWDDDYGVSVITVDSLYKEIERIRNFIK